MCVTIRCEILVVPPGLEPGSNAYEASALNLCATGPHLLTLVGPCGYAPLPFTDRFYRPIAETIDFRDPITY